MQRTAVFRCDASTTIGGGHVQRCLVLADTLAEAGWHCRFICSADSPTVVPALASGRHEVRTLADDDGHCAQRVGETADTCDLLVVDHYGLDAEFESFCRDWAQAIMVIDDLADRPHDCDILLDQTPVGNDDRYARLLPPHCLMLLGSDYALLRPQFEQARWSATADLTRRQVSNAMIGFGAVDGKCLAPRAVAALQQAAPGLVPQVVVGGAARSLPELLQLSEQKRCALSIDVTDMAAIIRAADMAIGAGGISALERCCLGLPSIVIATVDNQHTMAETLHRLGAIRLVGRFPDVSPADIASAAHGLISNPERLTAMSRAALGVCDGLGARRVLCAIAPPRTSDGAPIYLEPTTMDSLKSRLPALSRHAQGHSRRTCEREATRHATDRHDKGSTLNIVRQHDQPIGLLELKQTDRPDQAWRISLYIDPEHRESGTEQAALAIARSVWRHRPHLVSVVTDDDYVCDEAVKDPPLPGAVV